MALRTLVTDGVEWMVWDVIPSSVARLRITGAASLAAGWLVFDSGAERRRLLNIPAGWEDWGDEELERVLQTAELAPRRAGSSALATALPIPR